MWANRGIDTLQFADIAAIVCRAEDSEAPWQTVAI
jgi:hypothetical protein